MEYFRKDLSTEEKKAKTMKKVGTRIREIRKGKKLTQKQFAELLEIKGGSSLISGVEHGKRSLPASVLPIIAEMGDTSVESLFSESYVIEDIGRLVLNPAFNSADFSEREKKLFMNYMGNEAQKTVHHMGALKTFDLLFTIIWYGGQEYGAKSRLYDELPIILSKDYGDRQESRYYEIIKEIVKSCYEKNKDCNFS